MAVELSMAEHHARSMAKCTRRWRRHERGLAAGAEHDRVAAERGRIEEELRVRTGYAYHPTEL